MNNMHFRKHHSAFRRRGTLEGSKIKGPESSREVIKANQAGNGKNLFSKVLQGKEKEVTNRKHVKLYQWSRKYILKT